MWLQPGCYLYVGSAFGPGGLAARIKHHRKIAARPHWHMDYLRAVCDLTEVWLTTGCHEHTWAKAVAQLPDAVVPMPGFGSSDCRCATHLFWFTRRPSLRRFRKLTKVEVSVHR
jgi:Uri superfamily endonuclease